jgi:hypothetical protein
MRRFVPIAAVSRRSNIHICKLVDHLIGTRE